MTKTQAYYVLANRQLFNAARIAQAEAVLGKLRDLRTIMRSKAGCIAQRTDAPIVLAQAMSRSRRHDSK